MKLKALLFVFIVWGSFGFVQAPQPNSELEWYGFTEGMELAKKEGKIALIDVYTDWCGWCKVMDKKTFADAGIVKKINQDFIPIKFNPEKPGNYIVGQDTLDGRTLLGAISGGKHSGYPTTYFFIPGKNVMLKQAGYMAPDQFGPLLERILAQANSAN